MLVHAPRAFQKLFARLEPVLQRQRQHAYRRADGVSPADPIPKSKRGVDAEVFGGGGYEAAALAADESDLFDAGVYKVEIPKGFASDLGDRVPVRVTGTARGLMFYAKLLNIKEEMQLEELGRVRAAALAREDDQ